MTKDRIEVIDISSDEEDGSPLRYVFHSPTKKKNFAMKDENKKKKKKGSLFDDDDDDCIILDYNPFLSFSKLSIRDHYDDDQDLSVIAEKGQVVVACRDYPHSRHLCAKFPFNKTPHRTFCKQCYCYVCDSIAPCESWTDVPMEHCHATDRDPKWKDLRDQSAGI